MGVNVRQEVHFIPRGILQTIHGEICSVLDAYALRAVARSGHSFLEEGRGEGGGDRARWGTAVSPALTVTGARRRLCRAEECFDAPGPRQTGAAAENATPRTLRPRHGPRVDARSSAPVNFQSHRRCYHRGEFLSVSFALSYWCKILLHILLVSWSFCCFMPLHGLFPRMDVINGTVFPIASFLFTPSKIGHDFLSNLRPEQNISNYYPKKATIMPQPLYSAQRSSPTTPIPTLLWTLWLSCMSMKTRGS